jgi:hypothetical protein
VLKADKIKEKKKLFLAITARFSSVPVAQVIKQKVENLRKM